MFLSMNQKESHKKNFLFSRLMTHKRTAGDETKVCFRCKVALYLKLIDKKQLTLYLSQNVTFLTADEEKSGIWAAFTTDSATKKSLSFPPMVRLQQSLTYLVTTFAANLSVT